MDDRDRKSLLRILDANLNRAAEAFRAVEDVCRFHWNARGFAADLKALRHEVLDAVAPDVSRRAELLEARDVEGDVGRETPSPSAPIGPGEVAFRNLERAKEALRALEEASRVAAPDAAPRLERVRYQLYALEKAISGIAPRRGEAEGLRKRLAEARFCLLATASLSRLPLEEAVARAIDAGAGVIQLREKHLDGRELLRVARSLRELTARRGVLFIVNDRPDIALLAEADGVHVGQTDLSVPDARRIVGPGRLVGVSTHSVEQARRAERDGADLIGVGPMFPTATKDAGPVFGPGGLGQVLEVVSLPAFAVGGITAELAGAIREAGGRRVAVSSAVLASSDPGEAVTRILKALS